METSGAMRREAVYIAEKIVRKSPGFAFDIGTCVFFSLNDPRMLRNKVHSDRRMFCMFSMYCPDFMKSNGKIIM